METKKQQSTFAPSTNATGRIPGTKKTKTMNKQVFWEAEIAGWMNPKSANNEKEAIEAGFRLLAEFGLGKADGKIWLYKNDNPATDPYKTIEIKNNKIIEIY